MKIRCALCHAVYDEAPDLEDSPAEIKGVCDECVKREGLIPSKGETDALV